jgi:hypothetical protein
MNNYYTVDRLGRLQENQVIELIRYNDINPPELQSHVNDMFPAGVSHHGERYFLRNESQARLASPNIELLFEYVRRAQYPNRPSRFQSFFAFETIEQAVTFRERYGIANSIVWEVESEENFRADMNLLTIRDNSILVYSYFAHLYWRGETRESPFWEYLLVPPIKALRRIEETNTNI